MRKIRVLKLKRALGLKGQLSTVNKSHLRKIKKSYNKLNKNSRILFSDMLYKLDIEKLKK